MAQSLDANSLSGPTTRPLAKKRVLTVSITVGGFSQQVQAMIDLAKARVGAYVCCVNAHMTVEARNPDFAAVVNQADLATPDGMPVLMALRRFHRSAQERVAGNDLMPALLQRCAEEGISLYLYGGDQDTQALIQERARRLHPSISFAGGHCPPFGPLAALDLDKEAERLNHSGAGLVMVSLGCPKQERFMAMMRPRVNATMIGLGGAFLLYAGIDKRAPKWMRDLSLEWLVRLALEPRRLWRRYFVTNSLFLWLLFKHAIGKHPGTT